MDGVFLTTVTNLVNFEMVSGK